MRLQFLLSALVLVNFRVNCDLKFTSLDLNVVENFRERFDSQHVVFVKNKEDVSLARRIKHLVSHTYFTVINSSHLEKIFQSNVTQLNFFQRRATVVTKENLNLSFLVDSAPSPLFLTWVLFRNHTLSQGMYIPCDNRVFFVESAQKSVSVKQVYNLPHDDNEIVKPVDWKHPTDQFTPNFRGIAMNLLFLNPRESCKDERILLRKLDCIHWEIIELMGEKLNYRLNLVECKEKKFPWAFPNGTDSVLFVKLERREVDFSAAGHVIAARGSRYYLDFIWPTFVLKSRMYLKQGKLSGHWNSYLKPLESSVWWGILIWVFVFGILFHALEKLLQRESKLKIGSVFELAISIMKAVQVFCNQAIVDVSPFYSVRMVFFLELFVVLIFFQAYCAYLVSSLTIATTRFPFVDLKGFFANHEYQVMTLQKGFHQYFFRKILGKGHRKNFMIPQEELPNTVQEAFDKLCGNRFLTFTGFREDMMDFDASKCRIAELPTPVLSLFMGIAVPTKAPHKEYLRRELLNLKSSGFIRKFASGLSSQWDFLDNSDEFTSVAMSQSFSVFLLLGIGILLSSSILAFEIMISKVRRRKRFSQRQKQTRKFGFQKSVPLISPSNFIRRGEFKR